MKRLLPGLAILVLFLSLTGTATAGGRGNVLQMEQKAFLPIVARPLSPVEAVVTENGWFDGYPASSWVYGYVNSLVSVPVSSVVVGILVDNYPPCYEEPCESPYPSTEPVTPAFPVTLPGQKNPFSWYQLYGKSLGVVNGVQIISWSPSGVEGLTYFPLTVVDIRREGQAVIGRLRNDSVYDLVGARAVVYSNKCSWKEATLSNTELEPGQETGFRLDNFYCEGTDVQVVGQGAAILITK